MRDRVLQFFIAIHFDDGLACGRVVGEATMPQPNRNSSTNDPDLFERERSRIDREPSSVADDRPARRRNRILEEDPVVDDADVMPENDIDDESLGRSDR